ncbi:MAG: hypothetical protein ACJA2M_001151 [Polaribacter sp.]|jgi:hypothetical protein
MEFYKGSLEDKLYFLKQIDIWKKNTTNALHVLNINLNAQKSPLIVGNWFFT